MYTHSLVYSLPCSPTVLVSLLPPLLFYITASDLLPGMFAEKENFSDPGPLEVFRVVQRVGVKNGTSGTSCRLQETGLRPAEKALLFEK